jgi:CubicO group peptidase (beta-lactamase class C family)
MSSGLSKFDGNIQGKSSSFKEKIWLPSNTIGLIKSPYQLPGKFQYNDTNVVLLGIIAEFHSGSSLADLYRKEFLDPLNIQAITLPEEGIKWHEDIFNDTGGDFTQPVLAFPYTDVTRYGTKGFGNLIRTAPFEVGYYIGAVRRLSYACCGIVSTPENIARWAYELYSPQGTAITTFTRAKLIDSTSTDRVPPWVVKDGNDKYGYLISERRFDMNGDAFVKAYGHPGGGGGYSSVMYYSPELDLAVSILANSEMGFRGSCRGEKPLNCIVTDIFRTYWSFLNE